jgi:hypothetical protein
MGFTNRDRLRRKMKAIPVEVRKAARLQLKANATELAETQKRFAETSRLTGELIDSIRARDVSDTTRMTWRVTAGNRKVPYAAWVEFGTAAKEASQGQLFKRQKGADRGKRRKDQAAHHATAAQPFFWPAYRLLIRRFRTRMTRAAKKAVEGAIT